MGTNYYLHEHPACSKCGHQKPPLHIGKSSVGWCFALHVIPEEGIHTLGDWVDRLPISRESCIRDEYDRIVESHDLFTIITCRSGTGKAHSPEWLERNHAIDGPKGLARAKIYSGCIGHGSGTWDYIEGEFS